MSGVFSFSVTSGKTNCLREIDRIFVGKAGSADCVSPANICHDQASGFWVTLNKSGQILHLNEQGQVLDSRLPAGDSQKKPYGISVDNAGRIWVSYPIQDSIEIIDPGTNQAQSLVSLAAIPVCLKYPTGIHKAPTGKMLIADTLNRRIVVAASNGQIASLTDEEDRCFHEPMFPVAICGSEHRSEFWVIDIRNHCLRRFNLEGKCFETIGEAGLGNGKLVLPESVSVFEDGMLAVSQFQCTRVVKLFSVDGNELEMLALDYVPLGVLAYKQLLFVCELSGNHIRVYERI